MFIHGLTGETKLGTCASLPAFYIAIGRRLKYPLSLVSAKCHLFVRWEDQQMHLNIEAAGIGVNSYNDDHYRVWPYPITAQEEKEMGYLKSMTAVEECAVFLSTRGHCLSAAGRFAEALSIYEQAHRLLPDSRIYQIILDIAKREEAARSTSLHPSPRFSGLGMPPDPKFWHDPPEIAWMLWDQQQAQRRQYQLEGGPPDPKPGMPTPGKSVLVPPFGNNFGLPTSQQKR